MDLHRLCHAGDQARVLVVSSGPKGWMHHKTGMFASLCWILRGCHSDWEEDFLLEDNAVLIKSSGDV